MRKVRGDIGHAEAVKKYSKTIVGHGFLAQKSSKNLYFFTFFNKSKSGEKEKFFYWMFVIEESKEEVEQLKPTEKPLKIRVKHCLIR